MNGKSNGKQLKKWQRIHVTRNLNMDKIEAIGFDMDHTLARYNRVEFEALAFRETIIKFVDAGYPQEFLSLAFNPQSVIRGLLVDRERGNLLKVDEHKYVKLAFHGTKQLDKESRRKIYNNEGFKAQDFLSVDTFFALSEVQLFAEIVNYMNDNPGKIDKTFGEVYQDLRKFIDLCHADGSIKKKVLRDPEKYIHKEKYLPETLIRLLEADKYLFLLTNSGYEYTNEIMKFLLDDAHPDIKSWREYFHFKGVSASKPGFFTGNQKFYEIVTENGLLKPHSGEFNNDAIYYGGNAALFQELAGFRGDQILYAGDHIYGDIAQSKSQLNWRTLLIVEELYEEFKNLETVEDIVSELDRKVQEREMLDEETQLLRAKYRTSQRRLQRNAAGPSRVLKHSAREESDLKITLDKNESDLADIDGDIRELIKKKDDAIHPIWGELMRTGLTHSRFADQLINYACIYTTNITNMRFYSPFKRYTAKSQTFPHED